jgi:hypothetical protein
MDSVTRFFASGFFMNHLPQAKGKLDFFRKFADIFANEGAPPVTTTPAANLPPVETTPAANFATDIANVRVPVAICHRCQRHQQQIMGTISDC